MTHEVPQTGQSWRERWLPAALLIFFQVASGMRDMPQLAFFVIYLQEELALAPVTISSVVAGAQVAGMLMALLGGAITGRVGSKWVLVTGLAFAAMGSLAFQFTSLWVVAVLWLMGGAGLAMSTVGGASYLTRISARGALGILAAFYALSTTAGGAIGNPLAGVLIERYGFRTFSWVAVSISAVAILVIILLMEPARPAAGPAFSLRAVGLGMLAPARKPNVRRIIGLRSLPTIYYGVLMVLVPLLLNDLSGSKVLVAAYGTTNLVIASAAQLLAGRSADRWGARGPTLVAYSALVLSGLGLAALANTLWGLFVFGVLGIAAAWALATLMYVWVSDGVDRADHPSTFGLLHAVWSLSMITGSVLAGVFAASLPGLPFLIAGLLNVASLFLIIGYYRHKEALAA
jgi:MFS family permease